MGAIISLGDRWIKISNLACARAFDNAITVAEQHATTDTEREYITRLKLARLGFYSGYNPHFETLFPTLDERKFWTRCFLDAGRWHHEGRFNNSSDAGGASPAVWIYHTYWFAELLRELVRRDDRLWVTNDQDTILREQEGERQLKEYRIKHEAVKAEQQSRKKRRH